ncbi:hypothetical protein O7627_28090 [Solwaraspora sp. WMMD1047]|uniref:hypothetical protein n=1 Tax=Solwaraspora sp. WMMD1047 TaxID=3016102 RepID=UPI0024163B58|nr:hypothetical protein [Solwaraspora sp. WMMD1047]MDG4833139.1 hypothetical protein [Solwaraspora sp. WMMD1047]
MLTSLGMVGVGISTAMADGSAGSVTVTRDGTVLDGRHVNGYIHIKANNVTVRNLTVRYHGDYSIRVFDGFSGALIENTRIYCTAAKTNGIVFGNYTARGVHLFGCVKGFIYSDEAPATIVGSSWNGRPVTFRPPVAEAPADEREAEPEPEAEPVAEADAPPAGSATDVDASAVPSGFPGPGNTGVPAGTRLRAAGSVNVTTDGQVLDGLDINGCVLVSAANVVIRNTRIRCGVTYGIRTLNARNLLVEDSEVDGMGRIQVAVCCGDYTLRRVEITNAIDGPRLGTNTVVEDSWIHHLKRLPGSHNDTLQTTGASNIVVRGNTLESYNPATRDPMNACLMIGSTTGPIVSNLLFERNYCNGGNYSIGIRTDLNAAGIRIRGNVFGRDHRYGVVARVTQSGITWDKPTNVYADSLQPVVN